MKELAFASAENLQDILGVIPGAVTPLAIVNDNENKVSLMLSKKVAQVNKILCHPLVNTATVSVSVSDLFKIAEKYGHKVDVI